MINNKPTLAIPSQRTSMADIDASLTLTSNMTDSAIRTTSRTNSKLLSPRNMEIAGISAAAGVLCTIIIGICIFCCLRRRRRRKVLRQSRPAYKAGFHEIVRYQGQNGRSRSRTGNCFITNLSPHGRQITDDIHGPDSIPSRLPYRRETTPDVMVPAAFAPSYTFSSMSSKEQVDLEPQEMMGLGLSLDDFNRRNRSRSPVHSLEEPVELASQRFSAVNPHVDDDRTVQETRYGRRKDRSSRLRSSPGIQNLRVEVSRSRSPSSSPGRRLLPHG